ncbi:hypothetical protein BOX15_Mlig031490g1, partial [Macrostomum lignano]
SLDARLASLAECQRRLSGFRDAQPTELPSEAELAASWSGFISAFAELSAQAGQQRTRALDSAAATIKRVAAKGRRQFQFLRAGFVQLASAWLSRANSWRERSSVLLELAVSCSLYWICCSGQRRKRRRQKQPSEVDATAATVAKRVGRLGDLWVDGLLLGGTDCPAGFEEDSDSALEFRCLLVTLLHEYVGRFAYVKGLHPAFADLFVRLVAGLPAGSPLSEHVVRCVFEHYYCQYYPLSKIRTELSSGNPARLTGADIGLALTKHGFLAHRINYASLLRQLIGYARMPGTPAPTRDLLLRLAAMAACVIEDRPPHTSWKSVQPDDFRRLLTAAETDADGDEDVENQDLETTLDAPFIDLDLCDAAEETAAATGSAATSASVNLSAAGQPAPPQDASGSVEAGRKSAKKRPKSGKEKPQTEPPNADDNQAEKKQNKKKKKCHNEAE